MAAKTKRAQRAGIRRAAMRAAAAQLRAYLDADGRTDGLDGYSDDEVKLYLATVREIADRLEVRGSKGEG